MLHHRSAIASSYNLTALNGLYCRNVFEDNTFEANTKAKEARGQGQALLGSVGRVGLGLELGLGSSFRVKFTV